PQVFSYWRLTRAVCLTYLGSLCNSRDTLTCSYWLSWEWTGEENAAYIGYQRAGGLIY
ncbi:uncharacterized protein METZ01_LOCUS227605, partial [marine metagenome]